MSNGGSADYERPSNFPYFTFKFPFAPAVAMIAKAQKRPNTLRFSVGGFIRFYFIDYLKTVRLAEKREPFAKRN